MNILVHACCGPCAITVFQELARQKKRFQGFYYNPNIHPLMEYVRRRDALTEVARRMGVETVCADGEYDPSVFLRQSVFREKDRCPACYALRLQRTAREAGARGFGAFSTTLLYSKYQNHEAIIAAGREAARIHGVEFFSQDFRTGWDEGVRLSKEWELYRQPYCGCIYSEYERYRRKLGG